MRLNHSPAIWAQYPELAAGVLAADGLHPNANVAAPVAHFTGMARQRLAAVPSESDLPEIQAWRRAFSRMGLKPTQYRCASESLLRRLRKDGALPPLHPLVDLCNAVSIAFAIPIAVFDAARVAQSLEVRHAKGDETYLTFGGETERPDAGEVVFADAQGNAHARRWTNRQSGLSAVRDDTASVLIVAEAMHATAADDVRRLIETLAGELPRIWPVAPRTALLTARNPFFDS